jgi:hypothetical protein
MIVTRSVGEAWATCPLADASGLYLTDGLRRPLIMADPSGLGLFSLSFAIP